MLINFTISNYRSIAKEASFSLVASSLKDLPENTIKTERIELLTTGVVYGPNSAGKSNLLFALDLMKHFILDSHTFLPDQKLEFRPFLFISGMEKIPTAFEIIILVEGVRYRYGFAYNEKEIIEEWLYFSSKEKERVLFKRVKDEISPNTRIFKEAKDNLIEQTKDNSLFLSVLAVNNGSISGNIMKWFTKCNVLLGTENKKYHEITKHYLQSNEHQPLIVELFKKSDLFINDLVLEEGIIKTVHTLYNSKKEKMGIKKVPLLEIESEGTKKLFDLSGAIIDSILKGKVLFIDELDSSMHTLLTQAVISLFHNKKINSKNAQLIFTTHDTNLLNQELFRRDQIWFAEKEFDENTKIYPLLDYQPRNDTSLEKRYLEGGFGAIPYLGDFNQLTGSANGKEKKARRI